MTETTGAGAERLPEAEMEVLAFVQRKGEATAREIREGIADYRPLAHSSVVTLLNRLRERDLLDRRKADRGKAFVYSARRDRTEAVQPLLRRLLNRVYAGDTVALVASLFESTPPTGRQLEELERMVEELRQGTDR